MYACICGRWEADDLGGVAACYVCVLVGCVGGGGGQTLGWRPATPCIMYVCMRVGCGCGEADDSGVVACRCRRMYVRVHVGWGLGGADYPGGGAYRVRVGMGMGVGGGGTEDSGATTTACIRMCMYV